MTKRKEAVVLGNGIVGLTCARVLLLGGWHVTIVKSPKSIMRTIALQEQTKRILDEIWACDVASICNSRILTGRRIRWAEGEDASTNEISGLCIEVADFANALQDRLHTSEKVKFCETVPSYTEPDVYVFDTLEGGSKKDSAVSFGNRVMHVWQRVEIEHDADNQLEIFSGRGYWLIGLPNPGEAGSARTMSLQLALPSSEVNQHEILKRAVNEPRLTCPQKQYLAPMIEACLEISPDMISIAPSICLELGLEQAFMLGSRAMNFDPICGDGTGQGIKTAILAVAAVNSESRFGCDAVNLHMRNRMMGTFGAHLRNCISYYQTIASSVDWQVELQKMQYGLASLNPNGKQVEDAPLLSLSVPVEMKEWTHGPSLIEA